MRLVSASLAGFDRSIEEAAQNLGATPLTTFFRITLPTIRPGIVAAALFGFVVSFGNLEMSMFLVGPGRTTLPITVLQYLEYRIDPTIAAVSVLQILLIGAGDDRDRPLRQALAGGVAMARLRDRAPVQALWSDGRRVRRVAGRARRRVRGAAWTERLRQDDDPADDRGFRRADDGRVRLGGKDVTTLPPWKRNAGMVFQSYALFPHLSVAQNVAFGLEMRNMPKSDIGGRVAEALHLVRLDGLAERLPRQLSGGQQQRVALARALVIRPDVLLLDEPLSNLDAKLREAVRIEIRELQHELGITTVMVTHDQEEALIMADRLVVMADGSVRQVGSQRDLYERPADRFVAGFVGRSNLLPGKVVGPGHSNRGRRRHRLPGRRAGAGRDRAATGAPGAGPRRGGAGKSS